MLRLVAALRQLRHHPGVELITPVSPSVTTRRAGEPESWRGPKWEPRSGNAPKVGGPKPETERAKEGGAQTQIKWGGSTRCLESPNVHCGTPVLEKQNH